jgi:hypothetical protein
MPLRTHTGAGDTVLQSGLAVELAKRYGKIAVPCYEKYWQLGKSLYRNYPEISLYPIPDYHPGDLCSPPEETFNRAYAKAGLDKDQEMRIGIYAGEGLWEDFARGFYLQAGIAYAKRWESSPVPEVLPYVPQVKWPDERRIFLHDDPSRGFIISRYVERKKSFFPPFTDNLLAYAGILMTAEEIHVIDSAFFCLANQLPLKGRLFFHHYARPDRPPGFRYSLRVDWHYLC